MVGLLDADILKYRIAWAKNTETDLEIVSNYLDEYISTIKTTLNCEGYIGYLTGKNNFRHKIYDSYKENRVNKPKPLHLDFLEELLITKYKCTKVDGMEADDALSITQRYFLKNNIPSIIISIDKDILQVPGKHYNLVNQNIKEISEVEAYYNLWTQVITGDPTDNIKGIPGKGEKFAEKILSKTDGWNGDPISLMTHQVIHEYINYFGEYKGIEEFNKNYKLVKLLEEYEGFKIPDIVIY